MIYIDGIIEMTTSAHEKGHDHEYYGHAATATLEVKSPQNNDYSLAFVYLCSK